MGSFGENLRREREMRGVSLEEIANATKIGVRALSALEEEQFSKLPGGIFTRSFIRSYARYLGLDEEAILAEYHLLVPGEEGADLKRLGQQRPAKPQPRARAPFVALLVAAALGAGGYALYRSAHHPLRTLLPPSSPAHAVRPPASAAGNPPPASASAPAVPAAASANQTVAAGSAASTPAVPGTAPSTPAAPPSEASAQELVLQVAATQRTWVAVEADGKPAMQRIMEPNEIQTLRARQFFDVTTGNAQGIILTLNGQTLKPLGHEGEVKKVRLTLHDLNHSAP
jgi:cytoskeleton protein RodZ